MDNIKNLIFDFGNVIIDIDTKLSEIAFSKYGMNNFSELYTLASQNQLFDLLETGKINEKDFYSEFRKISGCTLNDKILEECWNALLIGFPAPRIEMLKRLKAEGKYRTFILSNTNIIHYKAYTKTLADTYNVLTYDELVEHAYFSHEIGFRKPGREIFDYIAEHSHLKLEESLFIDDNPTNIDAAKLLGFNTILLNDRDMSELEF